MRASIVVRIALFGRPVAAKGWFWRQRSRPRQWEARKGPYKPEGGQNGETASPSRWWDWEGIPVAVENAGVAGRDGGHADAGDRSAPEGGRGRWKFWCFFTRPSHPHLPPVMDVDAVFLFLRTPVMVMTGRENFVSMCACAHTRRCVWCRSHE